MSPVVLDVIKHAVTVAFSAAVPVIHEGGWPTTGAQWLSIAAAVIVAEGALLTSLSKGQ